MTAYLTMPRCLREVGSSWEWRAPRGRWMRSCNADQRVACRLAFPGRCCDMFVVVPFMYVGKALYYREKASNMYSPAI